MELFVELSTQKILKIPLSKEYGADNLNLIRKKPKLPNGALRNASNRETIEVDQKITATR
jgi:hypothetical protein